MPLSRAISAIGDRLLGRILPGVEASAMLAPYCWYAGGGLGGQIDVHECCRYSDGSISCV
ncbi:hypothetical protein [Kitasatospora sp. NPDC085879]|uniref:hypothetical protein n=1 Tax=Kitasatospora sp. NPDC085879 TaxID=3154769 RepID=UPI00342BE275